MTSDVREELASFFEKMEQNTALQLGFPYNLEHDFSEVVRFLKFTLINLGDPYVESFYQVSTRQFEKEVLDFFAGLLKIDNGDFGGYVTAGGTEGNLYGIYLASDKYPDGVLYGAQEAHYSIFKAGRMMKLSRVMVATNERGEMDCQDLERQLSSRRDHPAIVNLSVGTTMKGAIDSLDAILEALARQGIADYYIHCDGALSGLMLPFIPDAPRIDFSRPIDSLAISGHKFLGTPVPCGVVLARQEYIRRIDTDVDYIGSKDTTILGARCGLAPLLMWYALRKKGKEGLRREVAECLANARYLHERLREIDYPSMLNACSNTVYLGRRPSMDVVRKWQLAADAEGAHIVVMQNVGRGKIDAFVEDLRRSPAQPSHVYGSSAVEAETPMGLTTP
jgi:histidine decarboxylase